MDDAGGWRGDKDCSIWLDEAKSAKGSLNLRDKCIKKIRLLIGFYIIN